MILPARTETEKAFLVSYIAKRTGTTPEDLIGPYWFEALAAVDGCRVVGAVLYNNFRSPSIETHWAGEVGWMTRANLKAIFAFPFHELGCKRVTGIIRRKNKQARKIAERIGFKLEGVCEHGFDNDDAIVYGMTHKRCRWIL